MPEFDFAGQEKLLNSQVMIIGLGGLGSSAAPYLASAGVGALTLIDFDTIELSNLQRQIIHTEDKIGINKALSAQQYIANINSECDVTAIKQKLDNSALSALIETHDLVLDCTDNLNTREQINALCYHHKVPLVSGAAIRFEGQVTSFNWQPNTPCYHCLSQRFGEQQLTCVESGILSPLVGVIGAYQAMEAIKLLTGIGETLVGRLALFDGKTSINKEFSFKPVNNCQICG